MLIMDTSDTFSEVVAPPSAPGQSVLAPPPQAEDEDVEQAANAEGPRTAPGVSGTTHRSCIVRPNSQNADRPVHHWN